MNEHQGPTEDLISQAESKEESIITLSDSLLEKTRWREKVLKWASALSAIFTVICFAGVLCTVIKFYSAYDYHLGAIKLPLPLAPFLILLSPTLLLSTLFIVCFVTTIRFITAYSEAKESVDNFNNGSMGGLLERLVAVAERNLGG